MYFANTAPWTEAVSNSLRTPRRCFVDEDGSEGTQWKPALCLQDQGAGRDWGSPEERRGGNSAEAVQKGRTGAFSLRNRLDFPLVFLRCFFRLSARFAACQYSKKRNLTEAESDDAPWNPAAIPEVHTYKELYYYNYAAI